MFKRHASEAFEDIGSPASKKSRYDEPESGLENTNGATATSRTESQEPEEMEINGHGGGEEGEEEEEEEGDGHDRRARARPRQREAAPEEGYDDLYLDTINRSVLDFDFEKLCSVSLSNINVYACLVCGRYFQGRGQGTHAYFHAVGDDHHVFINMSTQKVYVLPDGYEVKSKSLDDIKYVSDPRYTREEVAALDRPNKGGRRTAWTLDHKDYTPGYVGMNNIKANDYLNVVVQALSHVRPLRNFFLLEDFSKPGVPGGDSELVKRTSILFRKIWNPRAFKAHVSPHELLQAVSLQSNKRFTLTTQSDPVDFLSWYLNNLHLGLGGSKTKPNTSVIHRTFQGRLRVESQAITAKADAGDRLRFEEAAEVKTELHRFLMLTLDLPPAPLFQDDTMEGSIIPQVPLTTILAKYDGRRAQEHLAHRKRYRLLHPLPPYLILHIKRFSQNKFVSERNPTIVTFDPKGLDVSPYVEPVPGQSGPIYYDLVANIVHEAVRAKDDVTDTGEERKAWKVQLRETGSGAGGAAGDEDEWVVCQDLFVERTQRELLYLGESYLQIWERRRPPAGPQQAAGAEKGKGTG